MDDGAEHSDNERGALGFGLPGDASGYCRHECPSCMREFKTVFDETQLQDVLAPWITKLAAESEHDDRNDATTSTQMISCPYCAERAPAQEYLHPEYQAYLVRLVRREIVEPKIAAMMDSFADSMRGLRSRFISVKVDSSRTRSPRPIAGPDPDDMLRVVCLACDERFKINDRWRDHVVCPACGTPLQLT